MGAVDVIAVVGTCAAERLGYARRLAAATERMLVPAARLARSPDPIDEAAALAPWASASESTAAGAVLEFPGATPVTELIGTLSDEGGPTRLIGVVCVVDAAHLLDDLGRDDYLSTAVREDPKDSEHTARAALTVSQIEFASTIVLVGWTPLSTADLATLMALVSHLSPQARLRLHREGAPPLEAEAPYAAAQERPGWVGLVNEDFAPHMTDPRVSGFRYERLRPLHPARLQRLLDERIEVGEFGTVIRSSGFCRLATRPQVTAHWQHVGRMISFLPLTEDDRLDDGEELLAVGQDLAFIGLDLDQDALRAALDDTVLNDEEFAAGPAAWAALEDPFPAWKTAPDRAE